MYAGELSVNDFERLWEWLHTSRYITAPRRFFDRHDLDGEDLMRREGLERLLARFGLSAQPFATLARLLLSSLAPGCPRTPVAR